MADRLTSPPGVMASYDQARAASDSRLDAVLDSIRKRTADMDEPMAAAVTGLAMREWPEHMVRDLLYTALIRLHHQEGDKR